jgi:hypothetical protein
MAGTSPAWTPCVWVIDSSTGPSGNGSATIAATATATSATAATLRRARRFAASGRVSRGGCGGGG